MLLATLALAACSASAPPALDASQDLPAPDTLLPPSDTPLSLAVDFAVENCPAFDPVALTCTGNAPLVVRFVPLATTTVTKYLWNFGDGSESDSDAPIHTYAMPGVYPVRVIATGVGGGVVTKVHAGFIVVQANVVGQPCDTGAQCEPGRFCVCAADAACGTGPRPGICSATCPTGLCDGSQVCAGLLTASPPAIGADPWQTDLCLAGCEQDADCASGLRCRTLPPGPTGSAWVHGCFAAVPGDVGDPCLDASGNLRDDLCASGRCADLGALGVCSMDCQVASCPPGSDCAVFGDGRSLCLRPCTSFACSQDSLLTCIGAGEGDLAYHLASPSSLNAASTYCAPKACKVDGDCLPNGTCLAQTGPGRCVKR